MGISIHLEGDTDTESPYVKIRYVEEGKEGVEENVTYRIKTGREGHPHHATMAKMGAACIVSPIVPDWDKYPEYGRDISATVGFVGLAGHWMKLFMHYMFLYKAKGKFGWSLIPE